MTTVPRPAARVGRWAWALVAVAVVLFSVALVDRIQCRRFGCADVVERRLFDLDAVDSLPRLFTTGILVAVAAVAWSGRRRARGRARTWWLVVTGIGLALAAAKLTSVHSLAKAGSSALTLAIGLALAAVALLVLWILARWWDVRGADPLVLALGLYAFAALGLDVVTGLAALVPGRPGVFLDAGATYVEELGEALTAVFVLATAYRWRPSTLETA